MKDCLLVGAGGFIGTVCRYLIGLIPVQPENGFPLKTFLINVAGAFAIGLIAALAAKNESMNPHLVLMLKTGVCGGFTTFSTFAYENAGLLREGHIGIAVLYVLLSLSVSVLAVFGAQMLIHA